MEKRSLFSVFIQTPREEKTLIILVCSLYSFCSAGIIGLPLWFLEPSFLCESEVCPSSQACDSPSNIQINWASTSVTLSTELALYCDRKVLQRLLLTMYFIGGLSGCLVNFLVSIKAKLRKAALVFMGSLFAISNILILIFSQDWLSVGISMGLMSFSCMILNSYGFILINEYFTGDTAKMATILMAFTWGTFGMSFAVFSWVFNADFRVIFGAVGGSCLLITILLWRYQISWEPKESLSKAPRNVLDFLREINKNSQVRTNYLVFVFTWSVCSLTYNDILLELAGLGGSLYLNMMLSSGVEILASMTASFLSSVLEISKSLRASTIILVALFSIFIFEVGGVTSIICMLLGKWMSETLCNLTYVYAPKMMTDKFTPYYLISVRLFSRICLLFLPHVNYLCRTFSIHAFVFLAILWACSFCMQTLTKEVQPEGIEDILNEFKVRILDRLSIISGTSVHVIHHSPEELLRNFEVVGGNLSTIRRSRNGGHLSLMPDIRLKDRKHLYSMDEGLLENGVKI